MWPVQPERPHRPRQPHLHLPQSHIPVAGVFHVGILRLQQSGRASAAAKEADQGRRDDVCSGTAYGQRRLQQSMECHLRRRFPSVQEAQVASPLRGSLLNTPPAPVRNGGAGGSSIARKPPRTRRQQKTGSRGAAGLKQISSEDYKVLLISTMVKASMMSPSLISLYPAMDIPHSLPAGTSFTASLPIWREPSSPV